MCGPGLHIERVRERRSEMDGPSERAPRQQALKPCPQCGEQVREDFVFCPKCGAELLTACPECHRAVDAGWTHCAYCGADLVTE